MNDLFDAYPHIKNRVIPLTDEEEFELLCTYGKTVVALDYRVPDDSLGTRFKNGVLFRAASMAEIMNKPATKAGSVHLTTYLGDGINVVRLSGHVMISQHTRSDFDADNFDELGGILMTKQTSIVDSYECYSQFNSFWKLKKGDDGYKDIVAANFGDVTNRIVEVAPARRNEIEQRYGPNFIIIDIQVPLASDHIKVEEGVLFWYGDNTGKFHWPREMFAPRICLLSYNLEVAKPKGHPVCITQGRFGGFEDFPGTENAAYLLSGTARTNKAGYRDFWKIEGESQWK